MPEQPIAELGIPASRTNKLIEGKRANLRYHLDPYTTNITEGLPKTRIDQLLLRSKTSSQEIDLLALLPKGWKVGGRFVESEAVYAKSIRDVRERSITEGILKSAAMEGEGLFLTNRTIHLGDYDRLPKEYENNAPEAVLRSVLTVRAALQYYENADIQLPSRIPARVLAGLEKVVETRAQEVLGALGDLRQDPGAIAQKRFENMPTFQTKEKSELSNVNLIRQQKVIYDPGLDLHNTERILIEQVTNHTGMSDQAFAAAFPNLIRRSLDRDPSVREVSSGRKITATVKIGEREYEMEGDFMTEEQAKTIEAELKEATIGEVEEYKAAECKVPNLLIN